ncbi:hypothetical protein ACWGOE_04220 [Leucobacter chromiiresistens]
MTNQMTPVQSGAKLAQNSRATEEQIEAAARAMAMVEEYDGCFERISAWENSTQAERDCGEVEDVSSADYEDAEWWRKRARAALSASASADLADERHDAEDREAESEDHAATATATATGEAGTHARHLLVTECWPLSCLEGDCDHRDENGEPEDMTVCPPTPMEVCVGCMIAEGRGAAPDHWDDCPLEAWPCSRAPRADEESALAASPASTGWHFGRSFSGPRLEDGCPCVKQACGLVTYADVEVAACPEHSINAAKATRQSHTAAFCPGTAQLHEPESGDPR